MEALCRTTLLVNSISVDKYCTIVRCGGKPVDPVLTHLPGERRHDYYGHGVRQRLPGSLVGLSSKERKREVRASIGFTADRRVSVAQQLLRDAASLLVYAEVLKGGPGQAFLKLLLLLRRGDDDAKILEAYGEFFRIMASEGHSCWQDYILDGILAGEGNAFAEAAASAAEIAASGNLTLPKALRDGAAVDLDCLQRIAVTESTLTGWVTDLVPGLSPEWRRAASGGLSDAQMERERREAEERSVSRMESRDSNLSTFGFGGGPSFAAPDNGSVNLPGPGFDLSRTTGREEDSTNGSSPPSGPVPCGRATWRQRIGGRWKWREALPDLENFYYERGTGAAGMHTDLLWREGKLMKAPHSPQSEGCQLSFHQPHRERMEINLERHLAGLPAFHMLLHGEAGLGKTWLLNSVLHDFAEKKGLRIVTLLRPDIKSMARLLEEISRHPRLKFAIVIDDLAFRVGEEGYLTLKWKLEGARQPWPPNTILCVTSPARDIMSQAGTGLQAGSLGGALGLHFGLSLHLHMEAAAYVECVKELAAGEGRRVGVTQEQEDAALDWLAQVRSSVPSWTGKYDVLAAVQYLRYLIV